MGASPFSKLTPFWKQTQLLNVVIDTPKAAPFKLKFDQAAKVFRVHKAMPLGFAFPFNFGFVPSTLGADGDSLDVLVLTDHVLPIGSVILGKLVAVLEAVQIEGRQKQRNDRLMAVPIEVVSLKPMLPEVVFNSTLRTAVSEFFIKYNELQGRVFRPLRYRPASQAVGLVLKHSVGD